MSMQRNILNFKMENDKIYHGMMVYHPNYKVLGWATERYNKCLVWIEWADGQRGYCTDDNILRYHQSYLDLEK